MRHTLVFSALLGAGLLAATSASFAASKSLVFCSEGSPAGFDTAQYTTATDNDAAEPLYNRLVEFEKARPTSYRDWQPSGIFPRMVSSTPFTCVKV